MGSLVQVLQLFVLLPALTSGLKLECFSCASNPNWSYYMSRISGLKSLNDTEMLPVAPLACAFDPMRIYADRTAVACSGYCLKWSAVKILDDGGLEVNYLRACVDSIMQPDAAVPEEDRCYQTPADFMHKVGVEYISACYCKGFMCNSTTVVYLRICFLFLFSRLLLL